MKVICLDDKNKPSIIPDEEWIVEGEIYTVEEVVPLGIKPGRYGYILREVKLSEKSAPYEFYASERFGIIASIITEEGEEIPWETYFQEEELEEVVNLDEVNLQEL